MNYVIEKRDLIRVFGLSFLLFIAFTLITAFLKIEPSLKLLIIDLSLFLIVAFNLRFFLKNKNITLENFGFSSFKIKWTFYSILLALIVIFLGAYLSNLLSGLLNISKSNDDILKLAISNNVLLNLINFKIIIGLLIPFTEEILFRGFLFKYIRQEKSFIFSAILSSLLFTSFHLDLATLPFTFLLGFTTAFVYEKSNSLTYAFIIHVFVNNIATNLLFLNLV